MITEPFAHGPITGYTLLTNISQVMVADRDLRLHASALLLQAKRPQVRVFGPSPSWPVADLFVAPYENAENAEIVEVRREIMDGVRLTHREYRLSLVFVGSVGGRRNYDIEITTSLDDGEPLEIARWPDGADIADVWDRLRERAIHTWGHPNFPELTYHRNPHCRY